MVKIMRENKLFSFKGILSIIVLLFAFFLVSCNTNIDNEKIAKLKAVRSEVLSSLPVELKEGDPSLVLLTESDGVTVTYESDRPEVINNNGGVVFPTADTFVNIKITFNIQLSNKVYTEEASTTIVVRKAKSDNDKYQDIKQDIIRSIPSVVKGDVELKTSGLYGAVVTYKSSNEEVFSNLGKAKDKVFNEDITLIIEVELNGKKYEPFEVDLVVSTLVIDSTTEQKLSEIEQEITNNICKNSTITENIELDLTSLYDSTIRYESSNEDVLSSSGIVSSDIKNVGVVLSFYITLSDIEYGPFNVSLVVNTYVMVNENEYYQDIDSTLSGNALKMALRTLITTTQRKITSYDEIKTVTAKTDADPNISGNIILFYSRKSVSAKWDGGTTWNREHVWPRSKSWFQYDGAGSDIHHLRPTNPSINSSRGNKAYSTATTSEFYSPADEVKGDIARIVFYLLTRYSESDNYPITNVAKSMNMLIEWNELDPVDNLEIDRKSVV